MPKVNIIDIAPEPEDFETRFLATYYNTEDETGRVEVHEEMPDVTALRAEVQENEVLVSLMEVSANDE